MDRPAVSAATADSIRPYVELLVDKAGAARSPVFALAAGDGWDGPPQLVVRQRYVDVRWCPSELAMREALVEELDAERALLLLTPVTELGDDVAARLFARRVIRPDPAAALIAAFDVRGLDATIPSWLVHRLVALAPAGGYERTGARLLDADRAWTTFLQDGLGIAAPGGLVELLGWAGGTKHDRLTSLPTEVQEEVCERMAGATNGASGVLRASLSPHIDDATALGLALRLLVDAPEGADRSTGLAHLQHYVPNWSFSSGAAAAWADAAERVVTEQLGVDPAAGQASLQRADRWVEKLRVESLAGASDVLSLGLRRRLAALGTAIVARVGVGAAAEEVRRHRLAESSGAAEVADLSRRLVAWLATDDVEPATFRDAAAAYVGDDAYADLARTVLRYGGGEPTLDDGLRGLVAAADARRAGQEQRFATKLAAWSAHAPTGGNLLGVEDVLATIVAPLATQRPVLVVVLDGTSHRVAVELLDSAITDGWTELRRADHPGRMLVVTALPSVTTHSRASLLSGTLTTSLAAGEQRAFSGHAALRAAGGGAQPRLFHKREIADQHGALSAELRAAVGGPGQVVGAVINAVDEHLKGDDQLRSAWRIRDIVPLRALLTAARDAGRLVVLLSDHGHVLEHGTTLRQVKDGGERWAPGTRPAEEGEVLVEGPRVLVGGGRALLAWSEALRFGPKKHGYHGGASAQEVVAPAFVLAPTLPEPIDGWVEAPYDPPAWWTGVEPVAAALAPAPDEPKPGEQLTIAAPAPSAAPDWVAQLLASPTYAEQRGRATRTPLADDRVVAILGALAARDGTMLRPTLAQAIGVAPLRLGGLLAALRGLLNYDGYDALEVDEASDTVRLRKDVLIEQFGLEP